MVERVGQAWQDGIGFARQRHPAEPEMGLDEERDVG
jgi:hypothetical protein